MKNIISSLKLFAIILIAFVAFTVQTFPQNKITAGFSVSEYLGTVTNGETITADLDLRGWAGVDSVVVTFSAKGEIDIDTVNFYPGNYTSHGIKPDAAAGVLYQAVTLDLAAAVEDGVFGLLTSNATKLTTVALRLCNGVRAVIEAQNSSGNDATDPNGLWINWRIFGRK